MKTISRIFAATSLVAMLALAMPGGAQAEEITMKGIGISGYVDAVGAFSRTSRDYAGGTVAPGLYGGTATLNTVQFGRDQVDFAFAATEFKLHFNKDFGDKAFAVASLSVAAVPGGTVTITDSGADTITLTTGPSFGIDLQQAAVGLNFGDAHVLLGRFYAPIGIESVDANSRATATLGNVFAGLEPFFLTGLMLHYAPDEGVGGFLFVSNSIFDTNDESASTGAGVDFGSDLAKAFGVGVTFGSGDVSGTLQYNVDWSNGPNRDAFEDASQLVDLSVLFENDEMLAGIDAIYRRENVGKLDADIIGIELLVAMKMDAITAGLRGEFINQEDPFALWNADGKIYSITPFVTYAVTDGVFGRLEYRADITDFTGVDMANTQTVIAQLNASFE